MKLDAVNRLLLINEALLNLIEGPSSADKDNNGVADKSPLRGLMGAGSSVAGYNSNPPASSGGLMGAGSSVAGYNSNPPASSGGLMGAGSSVAGYNSNPPSLPPGKPPTDEQKAERDARRAEARKRADEKQQAKFKKEIEDVEAAKKFNPHATRFYPRWNVKGQDRVDQLRGYMDYLRMDPDRLRLFKQQKAYASAEMVGQAQRARTAYDRSAASTAQRIGQWEAGQKQRMLDRIGAGGEAGREYVAAEGEARAAEQNLKNLTANEKSLAQIRAENLKGREDLEAQIRRENPPGYGTDPSFKPRSRSSPAWETHYG